jgi:methionyl-tRNA formyltransferase
MRLVFMGTGPVSATSLERVLDDGHEVPLVVTRPDRPRGRSGRPAPPEVKSLALARGLPVLQPERVREDETVRRLEAIAPRAIVVVAYNQLIPPAILRIPPCGCLNVHLSLLPAYRGAAPVQHAILRGEEVTGVTVMRMAEHFDTGPVLRQRAVRIEPDETAGQLSMRLAAVGADLLAGVLRALESGAVPEAPQDASRASLAPRLRKEDGEVDWRRTAREVRNLVRAMTPWPRATTWLRRAGAEPVRIVLLETAEEPSPRPEAPPGTVLDASGQGLLVAAGEGTALRVRTLQRAGARPLDARSFLNGCPVRPGDRLGSDGG